MALPVLVINRAIDADRMAAFQASVRQVGIQPTRIDALDAHRPDFPFALYADLLRDRFWDSDRIKPGAIGCFLSHRRAWQYVLDRDLPMALICEDDAAFLSDTSHLEQAAYALADFHVIFANGRTAAWCAAVGEYDLKPLPLLLADLAHAGGPEALSLKPTPGGDCYLVSRAGAQALLDRTSDHGIICGVDWAMVWNGCGKVSSAIQDVLPELETLSKCQATPQPLNMLALSKAVADQRPGPSVLKHSIEIPIADLTRRESILAHAEAISTVTLGTTHLCFACRSGPDPVMEAHRSGQVWDEPGLTALVRRFPQGGTFVDIGAHSGNHSVVMAKLGGANRIIAVEPNSEIRRLLETNMAINCVADLLDMRPDLAMSSKAGTGYLIRNRKRSSETMVRSEAPSETDLKAEPIALITGDILFEAEKIDAIKIDTSGSEVDVVKGLKQTLSTQRPLLLIDHGAQSLDRIERLADEINYKISETHPAGRKNRSSSLLIPR